MSFKSKIGAVGVALTALLTVAMLFTTVGPFSTEAEEHVQSSIRRAAKLAQRTQRLYSYDLVTQVKGLAIKPEFAKGVAEPVEKDRRIAVYDAINELDKGLAAEQRKPSFFGVVDTKGVIIARDLDPNADHGDKLEYPVVATVLASAQARSAVWLMKNKMMRAAVAPIMSAGKVLGAVAVAYDFTAAEARIDQSQFGAHVAYFMKGAIRASSFTVPGEQDREDAGKVGALTAALMTEAQRAMEARQASDVLDVTIQGEEYKAITGPLPGAVSLHSDSGSAENKASPDAKSRDVGYVVLASTDEAMAPVSRARWMIIGFGLLMLLIVIGSMWSVANHFVNAEDRLELGVNEMINGNLEYAFDATNEFEGLANALNVLLARLLGRPEPGEEEEAETWRADYIFVDEVGAGDVGDAARQLAAEPEEQYFARIYQEYIEARRRFNLPVDGITPENLTQKLRANAAMLKGKHKCQMVRFTVRAADGKVSFLPVKIG